MEDTNTNPEKAGRGTLIRKYGLFACALLGAFVIGFLSQGETRETKKVPAPTVAPKATAQKTEFATTEDEKVSETLTVPTKTGQPLVASANTGKTTANATCPVKGNISGKNKIYHVVGGSFYARVKEEMCFQTEQEAVTAGFRKSLR